MIQVNAGQSYLCGGSAGGAAVANPRNVNFTGNLAGSGNLVIWGAKATAPQMVSGTNNTFSGQWIVQCGWLQGVTPGSLGTNSITVDPKFALPMPPFDSGTLNVAGPTNLPLFEVNYDLNSAGTLVLTNGGQFKLHQNCCFAAVMVEGAVLTAGTHFYAELNTTHPTNFPAAAAASRSSPTGPRLLSVRT